MKGDQLRRISCEEEEYVVVGPAKVLANFSEDERRLLTVVRERTAAEHSTHLPSSAGHCLHRPSTSSWCSSPTCQYH